MAPAGLHHRIGYRVEVRFQAEAQGGDARTDQPPHVGVHKFFGAAPAQKRQAGGEQELAVEQVWGGILQLARLHPAQPFRPVAAVVQNRQVRRQLAQELCQGDETQPLGVVSSHGRHGRPGPGVAVH